MTKETLKKHIHKTVDKINDTALLEAVYTLLNRASHSDEDDYEISDEDLRILEERKAKYLSGKSKAMTITQLNKRIKKRFAK
jgi:hypothetical protein